MRVWIHLGVLATFLLAASASDNAQAANALERAVAKIEPCRALKAKIGILKVGIDKTKEVAVPSLKIDVEGNLLHAQAVATVACQSRDGAVFEGDVSATFNADLIMDLTTCVLSRNEIDVASASGSLADVVDSLKDFISAALKEQLARQAKKLCE